jgi:hypothetical protein
LVVGLVGIINLIDTNEEKIIKYLLISALVIWMFVYAGYVKHIMNYDIYFEELANVKNDFSI